MLVNLNRSVNGRKQLPAGVGVDVAQRQVLSQVFDPQPHQPGPLEGRSLQEVTDGAPAQVLL